MHCLGIECTAHTFGCGIVNDRGKVVSNEKASFTTDGPGMVPREVARFHEQNREAVLQRALRSHAGKIDVVAVSQGPGIGSMLAPGLKFARQTAENLGVPLVGVNHAVAHFEIGLLECRAKDPVFLYVSGGNTQVLVKEAVDAESKNPNKKTKTNSQNKPNKSQNQHGKNHVSKPNQSHYLVVGETLDIGIGNLLDKAARHLGLGFPGGPKLYELSLTGKNFVDLPYNVKGMDVCFSGLYTDFTRKCEKHAAADMAFSLQETAFDMVCEVAERAMAHFGKDELLLAGGVACSKILQEKTRILCKERGGRMLVPSNAYLTDNGAMIAWNGLLAFQSGTKPLAAEADIRPHWRAEDVDVTW